MKPKSSPMTTKIIGGKYRGKKIVLPDKSVTRSSKARLRESLFNTLQFDLIDRNFIEMFGGSGSVGLEAISRGAKRAWFIERDRDSYRTLRNNCGSLDPKRCELLLGDAFEELPRILEKLKERGEKAYLYIDPPFSIREGYEEIYDNVLATIARIDPAVICMIIVEHMTKAEFPDTIGPFKRVKFKKFGKSALSYYTAA
ncbi:16S rRNA (guanine(966)-N(2))-methyltransferase RsmD [Hydrogenimonas urashimensis]|uniref:16S rRNA (guanine(966)-N(2))-methyltransferase RsmD n=1 Tax=Hydrogenimonas urashimensis TaxID=2740515 RepID=UPI001915A7B5|nr:16S rRNA (guanine(966)-N(2))-methyltransferase RsmD [Hydrogenimonas urashimensis]